MLTLPQPYQPKTTAASAALRVKALSLGSMALAITAAIDARAESLGSAAGNSADVSTLPKTVVTGSRFERDAMTLPFSVEAISEERLRNEQMASSLPDALLETPSVMIQQTARGQGSPYLRGFTGFRTVALVDGIRLNNSTFRDGPNQYWSTVDALAIGQLEVMHGPGGVLYGSDAVGGTVNALMSPIHYGRAGELQSGGAGYYRYASGEDANLGRLQYSQSKGESWGYSVGVSGKLFGDVRGGDAVGRQPYTGYGQWDADFKGEWFVAPNSKLTFAYQRTQQENVKRTHRTIYGINWDGLAAGTDRQHDFDQLRELVYGRWSVETQRGDQFSTTVSWQRQDEFQFTERSNKTLQRNTTDVGTLGASVQGISDSPIGKWTYGVENYRDVVDSSQANYDAKGAFTSMAIQGPVADDSSYDLLGAYLQDEIPLPGRLHLFLGGRYSFAQADAGIVRDPLTGKQTSFEKDWNSVVGSGQLLWNPDSEAKWAIFGGASQGYRAPNLSDLTRFDIAKSGELETAAPNLKPEDFVSTELGIKTRQGRWNGSATVYHTFINDMIVRTPTGKLIGGLAEVTKLNGSKGWVQGFEVEGDVLLGFDTRLFGSISYQEGEADSFATSAATSTRTPLSRIAPLSGIVGVRWEGAVPGLFVEAFGRMSARQDQLSPDDIRDTQRIPPGGTPGWATANLRVGYNWNDRLRTVAALENILDEDYRIHGSGYNQPGRNAKVSLEYHF